MAEGCGCDYHPERSRKWKHCRDCGKAPPAIDSISDRGLCIECAIDRSLQNLRALRARQGQRYHFWAIRVRDAADRVLAGMKP